MVLSDHSSVCCTQSGAVLSSSIPGFSFGEIIARWRRRTGGSGRRESLSPFQLSAQHIKIVLVSGRHEFDAHIGLHDHDMIAHLELEANLAIDGDVNITLCGPQHDSDLYVLGEQDPPIG